MNVTQRGKVPARLGWARMALLPIAAFVAAMMAITACGGDAPGSSSSAAPRAAGSAQATGSARLVQFAQCMRSHGLANFPDPTPEGSFNLPGGMTSSAQFQSADRACRSLAPAGSLSGQAPTAQELNQTVKFVGCMRKHGVANFPDPAPNGTFQLQGGVNPIDPASPQFKSALSACHALLPPGSGFGTGH